MSVIALATWVRALAASLAHWRLAGAVPNAWVPVWSGVESFSSPALEVRNFFRSLASSSEMPREGSAATAPAVSAKTMFRRSREFVLPGTRLLPRLGQGKPNDVEIPSRVPEPPPRAGSGCRATVNGGGSGPLQVPAMPADQALTRRTT